MSTAKYPAFGQRRARRRPRVSLTVERLEDRTTPAVFVVNTLMNTTDASPGDGVAKDASGQTVDLSGSPVSDNHVVGGAGGKGGHGGQGSDDTGGAGGAGGNGGGGRGGGLY